MVPSWWVSSHSARAVLANSSTGSTLGSASTVSGLRRQWRRTDSGPRVRRDAGSKFLQFRYPLKSDFAGLIGALSTIGDCTFSELLAKHKIVQPNGRPITATTLRNWRTRVTAGTPEDADYAAYDLVLGVAKVKSISDARPLSERLKAAQKVFGERWSLTEIMVALDTVRLRDRKGKDDSGLANGRELGNHPYSWAQENFVTPDIK